jgi:hypothetical protein
MKTKRAIEQMQRAGLVVERVAPCRNTDKRITAYEGTRRGGGYDECFVVAWWPRHQIYRIHGPGSTYTIGDGGLDESIRHVDEINGRHYLYQYHTPKSRNPLFIRSAVPARKGR